MGRRKSSWVASAARGLAYPRACLLSNRGSTAGATPTICYERTFLGLLVPVAVRPAAGAGPAPHRFGGAPVRRGQICACGADLVAGVAVRLEIQLDRQAVQHSSVPARCLRGQVGEPAGNRFSAAAARLAACGRAGGNGAGRGAVGECPYHPGVRALAGVGKLPVPVDHAGYCRGAVFRGTLLGLLGRAFPRNLPFLGARTSWGGVVSVLLFVLAHGVTSRTGPLQVVPQVQFWPGQMADLVLWGTLFLWVRERSGSCFAAMATHNLINSCLVVGRALVR